MYMWRMASTLRTRTVGRHLHVGLASTSANKRTNQTSAGNQSNRPKAVIFDLGGVLIPSPGLAFKELEFRHNLPYQSIAKTIVTAGENGAWQKLDRGELLLKDFVPFFNQELSETVGRDVDISALLPYLERTEGITEHPEMIDAIKCLRAEGIKTAVLTNNWKLSDTESHCIADKSLFDVVVESCKVNMRKPEPRIYRLVLDQLETEPHETVFLDDLGMNLKPAAAMGIKTIKVSETGTAIKELEGYFDFPLRGYVQGTIALPPNLQLPVDKLTRYLHKQLGLSSAVPPLIRCFEHGQSNPTYFIKYGGKNMVLRKKPPGKLLPSAHAVEREYFIMKSVYNHGVPVPKMLALCEDTSVIGTPFYIMEHVPGRIFKDMLLPGMTPDERRAINNAMADVLARIHKVNLKEAGIEKYGKQGGYLKRNLARWKRQYEASKTNDIESMDKLIEWLEAHMPTNEQCTLIHGDFRLDNLIFHPTKPEVVAVLDWELSTLGDPLTDLSTNCAPYFTPAGLTSPFIGYSEEDIESQGIPTKDQYIDLYCKNMNSGDVRSIWPYYEAFCCFKIGAIVQGVYKRALQGQASTSTEKAKQAGLLAEFFCNLGWQIASSSELKPTVARSTSPTPNSTSAQRSYSTSAGNNSSMAAQKTGLAVTVEDLSPRAQDYYQRVKTFLNEHVHSLELEMMEYYKDPKLKWTIHPKLDQVKEKAKSAGLWNLFLPIESDPGMKYGAGLTNVEYAHMCELLGKTAIGPEVFNCSAPDTGNMEVLVRYGNEELKEKWLKPLLEGKIRSCFAMTEPDVASSDATNIKSSIRREGNEYVINGHKWWTSGAMDPRCKVAIFMGKTNPDAPIHRQQSMIVVPMDAPGVRIIRPLSVFGWDDAPHGHAEVKFENVRVPAGNLLLGEGRGFEIAQGRLGPGRIHHCMRIIGVAERALEMMIDRVQNRTAFGKPLAAQGTIQADIANSRLEIEQCRLLVLKAAYMMDMVGNKVAAPEIAMIKVAAPNMALGVIDRAIQSFGGAGVHTDAGLARMYALIRTLRIADGPDEVHRRTIARIEMKKHNLAKL